MLLPYMKPIPQSTVAIDAFGGYDHNLRIADGSLYDMKNLTSDNYPVLTPRKRRGLFLLGDEDASGNKMTADCIAYRDGLCFVGSDGWLVAGDYAVSMIQNSIYESSGLMFPVPLPRRMVVFGTNIVFIRDGVYADLLERQRGELEAKFSYKRLGNGNDLAVRVYDEDNMEITKISYHTTLPSTETAQNREICFSNIKGAEFVKQYSEEAGDWLDVTEVSFSVHPSPEEDYYRFFLNISDGDTIVIDNSEYYDERGSELDSVSIWRQNAYAVAFKSNEERRFRITNPQHSLELIAWQWGMLQAEGNYIKRFSMGRYVPRMDFVIECNNRLWGCRYGESRDDEFVNELYASQQGNFKNWYAFDGISTDSYVASCGASGPFTGAVNFNGRPLFFKENHYYLISGDYPAEYGYTDGPIAGVQEGSDKSLAVIDRIAYYKGVDGVYAFDGYSATCLSAALGDKKYTDAAGGGFGGKYYISMKDENDEWHLFVYDIRRGVWHHEDNMHIVQFCSGGGDLYMLDADGIVHTVNGSGELDETPVEWMAETGNLTTGIPYKKYLSKLNVRMKVHKGASVRIFIQYDESGKWEELFYMTATAQRSFTIPIRPKRCDHIKLKLTGVGDVEVYSIIKTLEKGSDL